MPNTDYTPHVMADAVEYNAAQAKFADSKSEQQKQLEALLAAGRENPTRIADVACGTGHVSYHLAQAYPDTHFTLVDLNDAFLMQARQLLQSLRSERFEFWQANLSALPEALYARHDVVICWQTLLLFDDYRPPLEQLLCLLRPGGRLLASLLLNTKHDVDVRAQVSDYTRPSAAQGLHYAYNTFSSIQLCQFLAPRVQTIRLHPCRIGIDLPRTSAGLGTYTQTLADGSRLQFSAGMLLNWVILDVIR